MIVQIGIDLASIARFAFSPAQAAWFARRIFTPAESAYAASKRYPAQHLAGAFAAKEAFRKALGRGVAWRDVGVIHTAQGAPTFALGESAQRALATLGSVRVHLSISHTHDNAAATVIIEHD